MKKLWLRKGDRWTEWLPHDCFVFSDVEGISAVSSYYALDFLKQPGVVLLNERSIDGHLIYEIAE
jgi:hypothetical protein